jgi:hypothetical protein
MTDEQRDPHDSAGGGLEPIGNTEHEILEIRTVEDYMDAFGVDRFTAKQMKASCDGKSHGDMVTLDDNGKPIRRRRRVRSD